jgi:hypothetical protein
LLLGRDEGAGAEQRPRQPPTRSCASTKHAFLS